MSTENEKTYFGNYTLEVTGAYSPNYTITYGTGTLTIVKAEQTLEWEQDVKLLIVNDQVELLAKASSGLPVTYTMESINGAELYPAGSKTYLECKSPCEFTITAVQNGDSHYYSTQRITKKVKIVKEEDYEKEKQTAIEDVDADVVPSIKKILRNGEIIIIRNGKEYDVNGVLK